MIIGVLLKICLYAAWGGSESQLYIQLVVLRGKLIRSQGEEIGLLIS